MPSKHTCVWCNSATQLRLLHRTVYECKKCADRRDGILKKISKTTKKGAC